MERREALTCVVLVEPQDPKNVGAVCRAMKTMGVHNLILIGSPGLDLEAAAVTAVHARDLLDGAVRCRDLAEAVRDSVLVAGITRRRGKRRKYLSLTPEQLADRVAGIGAGSVALVFGNEAAGLSDEQLAACHLAVHIPTAPEFPSLNLSHAVQIITYQIHRRLSERHGVGRFRPISGERLGLLVDEILATLKQIGFFTQGSRDEMGLFLRDILARSALARREADRLAVIFRKIAGLFLRARGSKASGSEAHRAGGGNS